MLYSIYHKTIIYKRYARDFRNFSLKVWFLVWLYHVRCKVNIMSSSSSAAYMGQLIGPA